MQILPRFAAPILISMFALIHHAAVAAPMAPTISVSESGDRAIARYGIAENVERQSRLAVKQLSFLLKQYPNAKTWAVVYNTAPKLWRLLEYDIERRQLLEVQLTASSKGNRRGNDFYPSHIHRAAQQSLNIEELWKIRVCAKR